MNEVTPPNCCLAHLTSSSSWVGKSCMWTLLWCWLPCRTIVESLLIWKIEPKSCQLISWNTISRKKTETGPKSLSVTLCYNNTELSESALYLSIFTSSAHILSYQTCLPIPLTLLLFLTLHPTLPLFSEQGAVKKKCLLWLSVHEPSCTTLLEPWSFLCFLSGARKWDLF